MSLSKGLSVGLEMANRALQAAAEEGDEMGVLAALAAGAAIDWTNIVSAKPEQQH